MYVSRRACNAATTTTTNSNSNSNSNNTAATARGDAGSVPGRHKHSNSEWTLVGGIPAVVCAHLEWTVGWNLHVEQRYSSAGMVWQCRSLWQQNRESDCEQYVLCKLWRPNAGWWLSKASGGGDGNSGAGAGSACQATLLSANACRQSWGALFWQSESAYLI